MVMKVAPLALTLAVAGAVTLEPSRFALEVGGVVTVRRGLGDPAFEGPLECVLGRIGQFSVVLPQRGFKADGVKVFANATVVDADRATCVLPPVVTAGNTTVCVRRGATESDCAGTKPPFASPYGHAFVEHYAAFAPAFTRRPYVREAEGGLLIAVDASLSGKACRVSATVAGLAPLVDAARLRAVLLDLVFGKVLLPWVVLRPWLGVKRGDDANPRPSGSRRTVACDPTTTTTTARRSRGRA